MQMKPRYRLTRAELVPVGSLVYSMKGKIPYIVVRKTLKGKCEVRFAKKIIEKRNWWWGPNQRCWLQVQL